MMDHEGLDKKGVDHLPGFPLAAVEPHKSGFKGIAKLFVLAYIHRFRVGLSIVAALVMMSGAGALFFHLFGGDADPRADVALVEEITPTVSTGKEEALLIDEVGGDDHVPAALEIDEANNNSEVEIRVVREAAANRSSSTGPRVQAAAHADPEPTIEDLERAERAMAALEARLGDLEVAARQSENPAAVEVRIVDGADTTSGFWRENADRGEEHFLVVQAVDASGNPVDLDVSDMTTGVTRKVNTWGVLVSAAEFSRFASEKGMNGTISETLAGHLNADGSIDWLIDTDGSTVNEWSEDEE